MSKNNSTIEDFFTEFAYGVYLVKTKFGTDLIFDFPFPERERLLKKLKELGIKEVENIEEPINFGNNGILPQDNKVTL